MSTQKQSLGRWGERVAARYLESLGYGILETNVRTDYGEIDLVVRRDGLVVFVEVKARSSVEFGQPEEAITPAKQQHLLDSAENYLQAHPELDGDWRVDVISVLRYDKREPEIVHFENALSG
jgi:putative endonuclease